MQMWQDLAVRNAVRVDLKRPAISEFVAGQQGGTQQFVGHFCPPAAQCPKQPTIILRDAANDVVKIRANSGIHHHGHEHPISQRIMHVKSN